MTGPLEPIRYPAKPWPWDWEQLGAADSCMHRWETVTVETRPGHTEDCDRCTYCHTPRCARYDSHRTRCVERRHHATVHIFPSGRFEPVGGQLSVEKEATP